MSLLLFVLAVPLVFALIAIGPPARIELQDRQTAPQVSPWALERRAEQLGQIAEMSRIVLGLTQAEALAGILAGKHSADEARAMMDAALATWRADMIACVEAVLAIPTLTDDKRADAVLLLCRLQRDDAKPADVCPRLGVYR